MKSKYPYFIPCQQLHKFFIRGQRSYENHKGSKLIYSVYYFSVSFLNLVQQSTNCIPWCLLFPQLDSLKHLWTAHMVFPIRKRMLANLLIQAMGFCSLWPRKIRAILFVYPEIISISLMSITLLLKMVVNVVILASFPREHTWRVIFLFKDHSILFTHLFTCFCRYMNRTHNLVFLGR